MFNKKLSQEVIIILILSIAVAIVYNYFNPNGVDFIPRDKSELMVSDSILFANEIQHSIDSTDTRDTIAKAIAVDTAKATESEPIAENQSTDTKVSEAITTDNTAPNEFKIVSFDQMKRIINSPLFLIVDARTAEDYEKSHIPNAINLYPYEDEGVLMPKLISLPRDKTIVVYCDGGTCDLSHELAKMLTSGLGFTKVFLYENGWEEWSRKFRN